MKIKHNNNEDIKPRASQQKNSAKEIKMADFTVFLEPFLESVTEDNYEVLCKMSTYNPLEIDKTIYKKHEEILKDKLAAAYIMNETMDIEELENETELLPIKQIPSFTNEIVFFKDENILTEFLDEKILEIDEKYKTQIEKNNQMRERMVETLKYRFKDHGYWEIFNSLHKELEEVFRRQITRKVKQINDIEEIIIETYTDRIEEFLKEFGREDQYGADLYIYPDIFGDINVEVENPEDYSGYLP